MSNTIDGDEFFFDLGTLKKDRDFTNELLL